MRRYTVLLVLILAACNATSPVMTSATQTPTAQAAATAQPTSTPSPQPTATSIPAPNSPAIEGEIVSFAVDYIVTAEIRDMADFIEKTNDPMLPEPPKASIIVYGPIIYAPDHPEWGPNIDEKQPIKVWWYEDDKLAETDQKTEAMYRYHEEYMKKQGVGRFDWSYYAFGIVSVAQDGQQAELYLGTSCGSLCGHGTIYKIRREGPGKWVITGQEFLWGS